ncbi:MAG: hypothetical protein FJ010_00615 [Chloroflexi bacterium]|nr:hypothetical protein [Chloroflexota bacterium]
MAAFPTHVWAIILILQDFSWVAERSNSWDAIGVGAYGLLIALVESIFVFVIALASSFLISSCWEEDKRVTVLSALIVITGIWAIVNQLFFLLGFSTPEIIFRLLLESTHPLRILYALCAVLALPTILLPVYGVLKSERAFSIIRNLIERLSLLTTIYLVLDLGGIIIILIRNLQSLS